METIDYNEQLNETEKDENKIIETIKVSEISDYSFSKQLHSRKNKIIEFLKENYADSLDNSEKIEKLNRKEIAQKYLNQLKKTKLNTNELLNEIEMFVDLFLVKNYLIKHHRKQMVKFNLGEISEKPYKPQFKTNIDKQKKKNPEKEARDNKKRSLGMMIEEEKELLKQNMDKIAKQSGYNDCSSALIDEFVDFYQDKDSKLKVATLWTSAGKSYATKRVTGKAFNYYGKELIVTPNKCNLPQEQELIDVIKDEHHNITEDEIVMLDSVADNIADKTEYLKALKVDILDSKGDTKYHKELLKSIDILVATIKSLNENSSNDSKDFLDFLREKVYDADVEFRSKIKALIRNDLGISKQIKGKTRKEQIKNLCDITEFKRLPDIFPQLKLYNAKVIIMSAMRMLYPIDMILFSHTSIIESDILDKNTNVVFDEIDDIYVKFLEKILKDMQDKDGRMNVFLFLETVYDFITKKESLVLNDVDEDTLTEWNEVYFKELKECIDQMFNYPLNLRGYTFKTEEDRDVLIYVTENKEFVSIDTNVSKNIIHEFDNVSKQIRIKTTEDEDNSTNELIAQINALFNNVKDILFKLTKEYYDYFNKKDVNVKWTYEQALSSILTHMSGDEEYGKSNAKRLFTEFVSKTNFSDEKDADTAQIIKAINQSGLANNYSIYTFSNDESHKESAILYCCFNKTSPEVLLFKLLIKTKKILGLSATGFLKSKKSNFDFDKIKECEKIYYEKNKNKLDLIEKEKSFTVSENVLKYKEAIEYQTNIVKPHSYTEILKYDANDTAYNRAIEQIESDFKIIIENDIAEISIDGKNGFIAILKNKAETVKKDIGYALIREFNQIHCILQCIINKNRTLLMIRNRKLDTDSGLEDLVKQLKNKVFIGRTVAYKSLTDLGKKVSKDDSTDEDQKKIDIELKQFYTENSDDKTLLYILFSSIATVATGVNLYQIIKKERIDISIDGSDSKKDFYWKIPDYDRLKKESPFKSNTMEYDIYIKADIDAGYHENKTHLKYQFKDEKYAERLNALYELNTFVCGNSAVDVEEYNSTVQQAMNCSTSLNQEKVIKESILAAEFKYLSQSLGRKERNVIGCKNKSTFIENSTVQSESGTGFLPLLERIDSPKYSYSDNASTIAITQQMKEIKQKLKEELTYSEMDNISTIPEKDTLDRMIASLWDDSGRRAKKYKQIYNDLKDSHLLTLNITMSREKYQQERKKYNDKYDDEPIIEFESLYIKKPTGTNGYTYQISGAKLSYARWMNSKYPLRSSFAKKDLQLDVMNNILYRHGAETIHMDEADDYIVSPVFADFVKGDIAEMVFEAIVNKMLIDRRISAHLDKYFEFFDYTTNSKHRYIDIKFWKTEKVENYINRKEINKKLDQVTGVPEGKVLLINMYPVEKVDKNTQTETCEGAKIQIINSIINKNGSIDNDICDKLYNFITKE